MPTNNEIAGIFSEIADILDIQGANPFRVRAYRNAARTVEGVSESLAEIVASDPDKLSAIPGIGKALHDKIIEFCATGKMTEHDELRASVPLGLLAMLRIPSFGPKRVRLVYKKLGVDSVDKLEAAADAGKIRELPGMGEKSEAKILRGIRQFRTLQTDRMQWAEAAQILEPYLDHLRALKEIDKLQPAGSYRRRRESVGDLDILATTSGDARGIIEAFVTYPHVVETLAKGDTKASVVLREGIQVDLRVVELESFGAALQYFTGSKEHNVALRTRAKEKGLKLSEYGVFRGETAVAGKTEKEVYASLGLAWVPPELRENRGEIEAAAEGKLPDLVALQDIKGDLHVHSKWSDGSADIARMVAAAKGLGYEYIAITDHSKAVTIAHGLDAARVMRQIEEIERLRKRAPGIHILKGTEVDILADGSLDLEDDVLSELDFVIAAVHSKLDMDEATMTARVIRAIENPHVRCLAHPTGRLTGERVPYEIDLAAVLDAAVEHKVAMEINAAPQRLDLNELHTDQARRAGVPLCISTDAHSPVGLNAMRYGVNVARRAWCTQVDVLNAWPWRKLEKWLTARKA